MSFPQRGLSYPINCHALCLQPLFITSSCFLFFTALTIIWNDLIYLFPLCVSAPLYQKQALRGWLVHSCGLTLRTTPGTYKVSSSEWMNVNPFGGGCWLFMQVTHSGRDGQQGLGYMGLEVEKGHVWHLSYRRWKVRTAQLLDHFEQRHLFTASASITDPKLTASNLT